MNEDEEAPEPPDGAPLLGALRLLQQDLDTHLAAPIGEREPIDNLRERADEDIEALKAFAGTDLLQRLLSSLGAWVDRDDPAETTKKELWKLTPDVVMFTEADRTLASTNTLDDALLGDVPAALTNLARLADLDLNALTQAVQTGQVSRRDTIKNKANITLANYFKNA
ncbi:MAG: hypothetical protein ACK5LN_00050 [Propioniciclava sp.]